MEEALLAQQALGVRMSGSGPTVFGIFETESACRAAAENLSNKGWRLFPAEILTESPFAEHIGVNEGAVGVTARTSSRKQVDTMRR